MTDTPNSYILSCKTITRKYEDVFKIFADAHKIIAGEIYNSVLEIYDFELDKKSLLWGSISPDILPKYKFIRHYKDESLDFVVDEIIEIIYNNRNFELEDMDPLNLKVLSRRLGVVSHYLTDFTCLPHAKRWTFQDSMFKHIKYEAKLSEIIVDHEFSRNKIMIEDLDIATIEKVDLKDSIKGYINHIVEEEYSKKTGFINDLDFALSLNLKIFYFVLDSIEVYSEVYNNEFILQT